MDYPMTQEQANKIEISNALKCVQTVEATRLTVCPEDYPPSEWTQYKRTTSDIQTIRIALSELYMLI